MIWKISGKNLQKEVDFSSSNVCVLTAVSLSSCFWCHLLSLQIWPKTSYIHTYMNRCLHSTHKLLMPNEILRQRERFYFHKINIQNKSAVKSAEAWVQINPPRVKMDNNKKKRKHMQEGEAALSKAEVWLLCLSVLYTEHLKKETSKPGRPLSRQMNARLKHKDLRKRKKRNQSSAQKHSFTSFGYFIFIFKYHLLFMWTIFQHNSCIYQTLQIWLTRHIKSSDWFLPIL